MTNLLEHVEQSIRERKLLRRGEKILVAVSGGLDSMVLLQILDPLARANRSRIVVAHFNHCLRGRSSDADERLVRETARRMGWPVVVQRGQVRAFARTHKLSVEMAARKLRHAFFARAARRLKIRSVALAHHADDQVELFFLRLFRGTGGEGLAGMKWRLPSPADVKVQLVRPLLGVTKSTLDNFARTQRIRFRRDASNASREILRNRIRHELLPLLRRRFQPGLDATVLRTMDIVGGEAELVTEAARTLLKLKPRTLAGWPVGLQRRVLQLQLHRHGIEPDFDLIEKLRLRPGKSFSVSPHLTATCDEFGKVKLNVPVSAGFDAGERTVRLSGQTGKTVFNSVQFRWRFVRARSRALPARLPRREFYDADRVGSRIVLRHWRAGDRFQPIGMAAAIKLQDWFTNRKIPREQRHRLVVATTAAGEVFWVEGQRIGERFKLTARTRRRLEWRHSRAKKGRSVM